MKVYLTVADELIMNGFLNLDALPVPGKIHGDISTLDQYVDDGEATEIIVPTALDYIFLSDKQHIVSNWTKKLAHGGEIVLGGLEIT